ncbi:phosphoribosyltransferase family protein [Williamsia sp. M5A3_1d]
MNLPEAIEPGAEPIDKYLLQADPAILRELAALIANGIDDQVDVIVGVEVGGIALAAAVALETGLPWSIGRRPHGSTTITRVVGTPIAGHTVVMVKDAAVGGGSLPPLAQSLGPFGAEVAAVAVGLSWNDDIAVDLMQSGYASVIGLCASDLRKHWA